MQKLILKVAGFLGKVAMLFLWTFVVVVVTLAYKERNPDITVQDIVPTFAQKVKDLQREAGCILVDAKIGPESITKINAKVKREYCQQAADWSVRNTPKEKK